MRTSPETPDEEHTIPWDVALAGIGLLVAVLVLGYVCFLPHIGASY